MYGYIRGWLTADVMHIMLTAELSVFSFLLNYRTWLTSVILQLSVIDTEEENGLKNY